MEYFPGFRKISIDGGAPLPEYAARGAGIAVALAFSRPEKTMRTTRFNRLCCALVVAPWTTTSSCVARAEGSIPALRLEVPVAALTGPFPAPGGHVVRRRGGVVLGVDAGWSYAGLADEVASRSGFGFGAKVGYSWTSGLTAAARYDDLGVRVTPGCGSCGPLQAATVALRFGESREGVRVGAPREAPRRSRTRPTRHHHRARRLADR